MINVIPHYISSAQIAIKQKKSELFKQVRLRDNKIYSSSISSAYFVVL